MIVRLILIAALLVLVLWFVRWFGRTPAPQVTRALRRAALFIVAGLLILLAVTGRLHWLFAAIGSALPFLGRLLPLIRFVPLLGRVYQRHKAAQAAAGLGGTGGRSSQVESRYLRMSLDHDTGAIDGVVLEGEFKGSRLHALGIAQLMRLLHECRLQDAESAQLLQAYLDNVHGGEWRDRAEAGPEQPPPAARGLSREEAYQILGLAPGATREEIIAAHRRLMQKLHPDRGGSDYLAAKINQAKDMLT